jgi:DNA (cytosine-5)-methyltransferase 1
MLQHVNTVIEAADLFCGAGGTSTGMLHAGKDLGLNINLLAINHWPVAINSHSLNHPSVRHKCETLDTIRPVEAVPGRHLHLLAASPECTHHSIAAGGRPRNDQSRASAWHICRWASDLTIDAIFIENVREFQDWGPLYTDHSNGCTNKGDDSKDCWKRCHYCKPIPERKGEFFNAFIQTLKSMGRSVEYRIQRSKEFGDPTDRNRLIIMSLRDGKPIHWPEPTHGPGKKPYGTARQIIDWNIEGKSIFNRKRPLAANTMRRIAAGIKKFGGKNAQPFLIKLYGTNTIASVDEPLPTVTAGGNHLGLVEPFVMHLTHHGADDSRCHSTNSPLPTVTGAHRSELALIQPFIVPYHSGRGRVDKRVYSVNEPLRTQDTSNRYALCQPFLVGVTHSSREDNSHSIDKPVPTLTTAKGGEYALVQPFLTKYYDTGIAKSVDAPLDTISTKDRFALVEPKKKGGQVDIHLRMLQPHELSAAMSFPKDYKFYGTREQQVKQIGNAVPVELARAHCASLLRNL